MQASAGVHVPRRHPLLGGPAGIHVNLQWLQRGLAMFLWASTRSLASLHVRGASALAAEPGSEPVSEPTRFQLAGSFVQYLFERHGMERLRRFLRRAERSGIESAAQSAFGKGFFELELEWESMLMSLDS